MDCVYDELEFLNETQRLHWVAYLPDFIGKLDEMLTICDQNKSSGFHIFILFTHNAW